jgi:pimeloyl-ACP methyl ester carboxylesterase
MRSKDIEPVGPHRLPDLAGLRQGSWASNPTEDGRDQAFKNASVVTIEKAGHWVHHDRLQEFLALSRAFLAS